jgi:hypothetical protein
MFDVLFSTGASLVLASFRQILALKYDFDLYKRFFMKNGPNSPNVKGIIFPISKFCMTSSK